MKKIHRDALIKIQDETEREAMLVSFLTSQDAEEKMSPYELLSCPTSYLHNPTTLTKIAKKYLSREKDFEYCPDIALKLLEQAAKYGCNQAKLECGMYYYNGELCKIDFEKAALYLSQYYEIKKDSNIAFMIGIAYLAKNNGAAIGYLQAVQKQDVDAGSAQILLDAIRNNGNYFFILAEYYFISVQPGLYQYLKNLSTCQITAHHNRLDVCIYLIKQTLAVPNSAFYTEKAYELFDKCLQASLGLLYQKTYDKTIKTTSSSTSKPSLIEEKHFENKSTADEKKPILDEKLILKEEKERKNDSKIGWKKRTDEVSWDICDPFVHREKMQDLASVLTQYDDAIKHLSKLRNDLGHKQDGAIYTARIKLTELINEAVKAHKECSEEMTKIDAELTQTAWRKELIRNYYVQKRFFNPRRTTSVQTERVAIQLQLNRLSKTSRISDFTNIPLRRMITAERSTIDASQAILSSGVLSGRNKLGWVVTSDNKGIEESIRMGDSTIKYYQKPSAFPNHLGNYYLTVDESSTASYSDICQFLEKIAGSTSENPSKENEIKLADDMLRYAKAGEPMTLDRLKAIYPSAAQTHVNQCNQIFYHIFVKENARWMASLSEQFDIPAAIIQARAVKLIAGGFIPIRDVFQHNAPYGVMTGVNLFTNHTEVKQKIKNINKLYNEKIFRPKLKSEVQNFLNYPDAMLIASCKQLRNELVDTYGGGSDTDEGSGYTSSDEECRELAKILIP